MQGQDKAIDILNNYKNLVWPEVNKYLKSPKYPKAFEIPKNFQSKIDRNWEIVRDYPERKGKYLRPTLLLLCAQAMGVNIKKALKVAAAMQISEEWILIHDDFEDNSLERRGKPTLHRLHGQELAVNAGDVLHSIMWKVIFDNKKVLGDKKTFEIAEEFYQILLRTEFGQAVEEMWKKEKKMEFTDNDWFFIADGKSCYYTIAGPLRLGGIIGNASKKQLELLSEFGLYLGRCFQIVDDVLDVKSDFSGLKKQIGNDIYESKRTIILGHLFRNISKSEKLKLTKIINKSREEKTDSEIKWVLKKMQEYKSIEYARKLATHFRDKSLDMFNNKLGFISKPEARKKLETLIHFVLERNH